MRDTRKFRPARDTFENVTEKIPQGPFGAIGRGNVLGAVGYIVVESGEVLTIPIPGVTRPGFRQVSHGFKGVEGGKQIHELIIHAFSKDVAEFATQYNTAPSNYDFLKGQTEILEIEELDRENIYTTYRIKVGIDREAVRNVVED